MCFFVFRTKSGKVSRACTFCAEFKQTYREEHPSEPIRKRKATTEEGGDVKRVRMEDSGSSEELVKSVAMAVSQLAESSLQREKREAEWYERQEQREAEWDTKREKWEQEHLGFLQEISDRLDDIRGPLLAQARVYLHEEKGYGGGDVVAGKVGRKNRTSIGVQSEEQVAGPSGTGESEKGKEKEIEEEQVDEN